MAEVGSGGLVPDGEDSERVPGAVRETDGESLVAVSPSESLVGDGELGDEVILAVGPPPYKSGAADHAESWCWSMTKLHLEAGEGCATLGAEFGAGERDRKEGKVPFVWEENNGGEDASFFKFYSFDIAAAAAAAAAGVKRADRGNCGFIQYFLELRVWFAACCTAGKHVKILAF